MKNLLSEIAKKNDQVRGGIVIVDLNRPGVTTTEDDLLQACNGDIGKWVREKLNAPDIRDVLVLPKGNP